MSDDQDSIEQISEQTLNGILDGLDEILNGLEDLPFVPTGGASSDFGDDTVDKMREIAERINEQADQLEQEMNQDE
jgi:hypothetical protein